MNKFFMNEDGKLEMHTPYNWMRDDPDALTNSLTSADMVRILDMCHGDTSVLGEHLRQAIAIKSAVLVQHQQELAEVRKAGYQRRSAAFHRQIMDEIRELSGGAPFTATTIQLAAAKQSNFPVRSWQMYQRHMAKALMDGEPVKCENAFPCTAITYVLKNGTEKTRIIGYSGPGVWSFTD